MPTLYILSGLPFSGKSTFAKKVEEMTMLKRVSFDDLWASFVAVDEKISYENMMKEIKRLIEKHLEKGYSIMYDSTNLKTDHRRAMIDLANETDADPIVIYFSITEEEMRKRQEESLIDKTHHIVNEDTIQNALEFNDTPEHCVLVETEDDKEKLLGELVEKYPRE